MKILYIISGLPQEGAQVVLYQNLLNLNRKKYQVKVISLMDVGPIGEEIKRIGVSVYAVNMAAGKPTLAALWRFYEILKSCGEQEIIQGWDYHGNFAAVLAKFIMRWKASLVWGIHHTPFRLSQEGALTRLLIRWGALFSKIPKKIIYVSFASKNRHEALGYNSIISQIIPNGFDLSRFKPSEDFASSVRNELGLRQNDFLVGSFARFHPMKDHKNLLDAAKLISEKYSNVKFILAGNQIDNQNKFIVDIIKKYQLDSMVFLLGIRQDISRIMASLDVYVVSSAWGESFPMVVGEAMSCGVPCIVTDVGDAARMVGETGFIVPPQDPYALYNVMDEIILMSPNIRHDLGEKARKRVERNFTVAKMIDAYENMYQELS